jgi:tetratricopeptide (TPR) repeat protein
LNRAIALDPDGATEQIPGESHFQRGLLLHRDKKFAEALKAYEAALKLNPAHASAHCARAELLVDLNRHEEARKALDRYLELERYRFESSRSAGGTARAKYSDLDAALDE